jgi:hypothetical protein
MKTEQTEPVLLGGFTNLQLVDLRYHIDWKDCRNSYLELIAEASGRRRHLRFSAPRNVHIEEGFTGTLSGMEVLDISSRQWDNTRIEVVNFEQDPGITLLAAEMEIVNDT